MEYGINENNKEFFEIKADHFKSSIYLKLWWNEQISGNIIVKSHNIQAEHPWTVNFIIIEAII